MATSMRDVDRVLLLAAGRLAATATYVSQAQEAWSECGSTLDLVLGSSDNSEAAHLLAAQNTTSESLAEILRSVLRVVAVIHDYRASIGTASGDVRSGPLPAAPPSSEAVVGDSPWDRLPRPTISTPAEPTSDVTDDPSTWPGSVTQDASLSHTDERFSADEEAIASRLARTGNNVVRRLSVRAFVRTADATVNGDPVEFKTLHQRDGQVVTHKTVKKTLRKSQSRGGQSPDVIVDARDTTLTADDASDGLKAYVNAPGNEHKLMRVRIWGRDFDFDWRRST